MDRFGDFYKGALFRWGELENANIISCAATQISLEKKYKANI
jgi:hypothetical protein